MTKLATYSYDDDDANRDSSLRFSNNDIIQPSLSTMLESKQNTAALEDDFNILTSKGRLFHIYNSFFSPVYVYYRTISTSYVYTDTTTFFLSSCIPQPFSYSICRTLPG